MKTEELMKIEGMTEEVAKKVAEQWEEALKEFVPKTRFDEADEARKNAESLVKTRDKQLEDLKKSSGDNEALKSQIETLQNENKAAKEKYEADIRKLQIDNAVQSALKDAGAKNTVAVMALLKDIEKAELAEDGTVKGLAEQIEALQKSDGYLFEEARQQKLKGFQPGRTGSTKPGSRVDMSKMSYEELAEYIESNPDVE